MTGAPESLRIGVTLALLLAGAYCLWGGAGLGRARSRADRLGYGLHAVMCASMLAMVWSPPNLAGWQMAVFGVACGWFVVRALGVSAGSLRLAGAATAPIARGDNGDRLRCLHHAVLMAVMVWMVTAMSGSAMVMSGSWLAGLGATYAAAVAALLLIAVIATRRPSRHHGRADDAVHAIMTAGMAAMLLVLA
jgi:hypothetical protein